MKQKLNIQLWLTLIALSGVGTAHAQQKIGTIDMQKVFDGYYKTQIANKQLKDQGAEFQETEKGMYQDYETLNREYKQLVEQANNQALSSEERNKRKLEADAKLRDIKQLEDNIQKFRRTAQTTLGEKQKRLRDNILREVQEVVKKKAEEAGYDMVLDIAATSGNDTLVVLYTNKKNDITKDILAILNANAPPDFKFEETDKAGDETGAATVETEENN